MSRAEKIAVLRERGDEHCRHYEAALMLGHAAAARREMRAFQRAYGQAASIEEGFQLSVRVMTRNEALAAEAARVRELYNTGVHQEVQS